MQRPKNRPRLCRYVSLNLSRRKIKKQSGIWQQTFKVANLPGCPKNQSNKNPDLGLGILFYRIKLF